MAVQNSELRARARAARYPIDAPVAYRAAGGGWLEGRSMNVSGSGLLFQTPHPILAADVRIDVRVRLSRVQPGAADLAGSARVVRGRFGDSPAVSVIGVVFDRFDLEAADAQAH
jgi:hypothetical protein